MEAVAGRQPPGALRHALNHEVRVLGRAQRCRRTEVLLGFANQDFPRRDAIEFRGQQLCFAASSGRELSRRNVYVGQSPGAVRCEDGGQVVCARTFEAVGIRHQARSDDLDDLAPYQPTGLGGLLHLLRHCDRVSGREQPADVALGRMKRNPAHRNRIRDVLVAGGEYQVEERGGDLGIL